MTAISPLEARSLKKKLDTRGGEFMLPDVAQKTVTLLSNLSEYLIGHPGLLVRLMYSRLRQAQNLRHAVDV